jgi:multiple sugar transport system substrate-binding protein
MPTEGSRPLSRRAFLGGSAAGLGFLAGSAARAAWGQPGRAPAAKVVTPELADFEKAGIDWKQAAGETVTVMVIPANLFAILQELTPQFTKLTGVNVDYQIIPPLQLREKHILDLSTRAGRFATAATDPMYYPLYAVNGWIDELAPYLDNPKVTNKEWLDLPDIIPAWLEAIKYKGKLYGLPYDGEATIHVYRSDLYKAKKVPLPETLAGFVESARKLHDPQNNLYGAALRGFRGPGQNMYIYPSLFREFGGEWFDKAGQPTVNSKAGVDALTWYVDLLNAYAPRGVENWNWPEELDAFISGTVAQYIDGSAPLGAVANPKKSKVVGKVGFGRWPKGPTGKRVTSIWNWSFPINKAIPEKTKLATWLWIQWMASKPLQIRSSSAYKGDHDKRAGVPRQSIWRDEEYRRSVDFGPAFADTVLATTREDSDVDWRPRVPQWPAIGNTMAIAVQKALVKQSSPREALDEANALIVDIMKKGA